MLVLAWGYLLEDSAVQMGRLSRVSQVSNREKGNAEAQ